MAKTKRDLDEAVERWRIFHDKENPRELITVPHGFPKTWQLAGRAVTTYYTSDKWGSRMHGYYHEHDPEVYVYVPRGTFDWAEVSDCPIETWPDSAAVLGFADGFDFERADDGEMVEGDPGDEALLCCSPDGKFLFVVASDGDIVALIVGDPITVRAEGIVG